MIPQDENELKAKLRGEILDRNLGMGDLGSGC
jgi:hypothetical protein